MRKYILILVAFLVVLSGASKSIFGEDKTVSESVEVFVSPNQQSLPLFVTQKDSEYLKDIHSPIQEELKSAEWQIGNWTGVMKGYVRQGSSNKDLTLNAGAMVYQEPSLDSEVITIVNDYDEELGTFSVIDSDGEWELVEFQKPIKVYFKPATTIELSVDDQIVNTEETTAVTVEIESEGTQAILNSGIEEDAIQGSVVIKNGWVVSTASAYKDESVSSEDNPLEEEMILISSNGRDSNNSILEQEDNTVVESTIEEEVCENLDNNEASQVVCALPPVEEDPLAKKCNKPIASPSCLIRQFDGILMRCPGVIGCKKYSPYVLKDCYGKVIGYLDFRGSTYEVCKYLNRCVTVRGIIQCTAPGAPLLIDVKVIKLRQ